jgi:hypothetical protein
MKANIVCQVCEAILGELSKDIIDDYTIASYQGCFTCDCGGPANLVIAE